MSKEEWMAGLRDPERRKKWLEMRKREAPLIKKRQDEVQAALDSDDPDAAIAAIYQRVLDERRGG